MFAFHGVNIFCREELLEQTQVSRRYEARAKDLKTLLDSSNDKLQVRFLRNYKRFTSSFRMRVSFALTYSF